MERRERRRRSSESRYTPRQKQSSRSGGRDRIDAVREKRRNRKTERTDYIDHEVQEEFRVGDFLFEKGDKIRIYPKIEEKGTLDKLKNNEDMTDNDMKNLSAACKLAAEDDREKMNAAYYKAKGGGNLSDNEKKLVARYMKDK